MNFIKENEIERGKWEQFLAENSFANPFQSPGFYDYFNIVPTYSARVYAVEDHSEILALCVVTIQKQDNGIIGYLSRRGIVYAGPLLVNSDKGKEAFALLLSGMKADLSGKAIYCETYNFFDYSGFRSIFEEKGWEYEPHLNVQMNIAGKSTEAVLGMMKYNRRREITLSLKEGAGVREAANIDEVKKLYNLLVDLYNERVKLPLPSYTFFKEIFLSSVGKVFVVHHNNEIIGGSFCIFLPGHSIYTYYYCGLRSYQKNIFPSHLAVYGAIEYAATHGMNKVDLMGAGKPDKEYGVREFKVRFGGDLLEQGRFLKVLSPVFFVIGKAGLQFIKLVKR
jgi:lipid II:glycine glycyltransferase (peptidoglycan interpeptide bridge formation enzyme)